MKYRILGLLVAIVAAVLAQEVQAASAPSPPPALRSVLTKGGYPYLGGISSPNDPTVYFAGTEHRLRVAVDMKSPRLAAAAATGLTLNMRGGRDSMKAALLAAFGRTVKLGRVHVWSRYLVVDATA
jgi:hypothetical protein